MKKITFLLLVLVLAVSCSEDDNSPKETSCYKSAESFNNANGIVLNLTSQKWYMKENNLGGVDLGVSINGDIQRDSATIETYGDGCFGNAKIDLNSQKTFNQDFGISFTTSPISDKYITVTTTILVFSGQDTLKADISSNPLENVQLY